MRVSVEGKLSECMVLYVLVVVVVPMVVVTGAHTTRGGTSTLLFGTGCTQRTQKSKLRHT